MSANRLDEYLARNCAPTLMGSKAASLVSLPRQEFPDLEAQAEAYQKQLEACGVRFAVLRESERRGLLYVYRPDLLEKNLRTPEAKRFLAYFGYRQNAPLDQLLGHLRERLQSQSGFPHEIGLFLDYPVEDVRAFMETGGCGCKLCGYWKVYHNVEEAKRRFACFDACRDCLCRAVLAGGTISQLLHAA